jgi:hypothetical protein
MRLPQLELRNVKMGPAFAEETRSTEAVITAKSLPDSISGITEKVVIPAKAGTH